MTTTITQTRFLRGLTEHSVVVYLLNGIKLMGILGGDDADAIFLRPHDSRDELMMVMKQAISTILPLTQTRTSAANGDELDSVLRTRQQSECPGCRISWLRTARFPS